MKKALLIFLIFFLCLGYVFADEDDDEEYNLDDIDFSWVDIKCTYNIKNVGDVDLFKLEVVIAGFNYELNDGYHGFRVFYENNEGKMIQYDNSGRNKSVTDFKNYNLNPYPISFFDNLSANEATKFVNYFKEKGECMPVYFNLGGMADLHTITTYIFHPDGKKQNNASKLQLKPDIDWLTKQQFEELYEKVKNKDKTTTETPKTEEPKEEETKKEDLVCTYKMGFEQLVQVQTVVFKTHYYRDTVTYTIKVNDREQEIKSFDKAAIIQIGNYSQGSNVVITPDDLKKLFSGGKCIDGKKICQYLSSKEANNFYITLDSERAYNDAMQGRVGNGSDGGLNGCERTVEKAKIDFNLPTEKESNCADLLGPNLTAIVKYSITILQIIGAIAAIVKAMITLIPPIISKDADALKKASKTLVSMTIILVVIFLIKPLLLFIGRILDFDISCLL